MTGILGTVWYIRYPDIIFADSVEQDRKNSRMLLLHSTGLSYILIAE